MCIPILQIVALWLSLSQNELYLCMLLSCQSPRGIWLFSDAVTDAKVNYLRSSTVDTSRITCMPCLAL
jgi:hypothetical protein